MIRSATAAALLVAAVPWPATAEPVPAGMPCTAVWTENAFAGGGVQVAAVDAGPVAFVDGTTLPPGRVVCTFVQGYTHLAPPLAVARSVTTPGAAYLPPTLMEFTTAPGDALSLCASVEIAGGATYYWDGIVRVWTSAASAYCGAPTRPYPPDVIYPEPLDPACLTTRGLAPYGAPVVEDDGDVRVDGEPVWDCPPYESRASVSE